MSIHCSTLQNDFCDACDLDIFFHFYAINRPKLSNMFTVKSLSTKKFLLLLGHMHVFIELTTQSNNSTIFITKLTIKIECFNTFQIYVCDAVLLLLIRPRRAINVTRKERFCFFISQPYTREIGNSCSVSNVTIEFTFAVNYAS